MRKLAVYVHGKGGNATESEHYKPLLPEYDVIGFDYKSETPWDAKQARFPHRIAGYSVCAPFIPPLRAGVPPLWSPPRSGSKRSFYSSPLRRSSSAQG